MEFPTLTCLKDRVPAKRFFHPMGFHAWDKLNNQYQGTSPASYLGS